MNLFKHLSFPTQAVFSYPIDSIIRFSNVNDSLLSLLLHHCLGLCLFFLVEKNDRIANFILTVSNNSAPKAEDSTIIKTYQNYQNSRRFIGNTRFFNKHACFKETLTTLEKALKNKGNYILLFDPPSNQKESTLISHSTALKVTNPMEPTKYFDSNLYGLHALYFGPFKEALITPYTTSGYKLLIFKISNAPLRKK